MTYYGAKDLANAFRTVRNNTISVAEEIPEDRYDFRPSPQSMSVAQILRHIAISTRVPLIIHRDRKLKDMTGFDFMAEHGKAIAEGEKARSKAQLIALLKSEGDAFTAFLEGVSEEALGETVTFPAPIQPPSKVRFEMLLSPKEHEMHHRAQLMLIQRMLGITPHLTRRMEAIRAQIAARS